MGFTKQILAFSALFTLGIPAGSTALQRVSAAFGVKVSLSSGQAHAAFIRRGKVRKKQTSYYYRSTVNYDATEEAAMQWGSLEVAFVADGAKQIPTALSQPISSRRTYLGTLPNVAQPILTVEVCEAKKGVPSAEVRCTGPQPTGEIVVYQYPIQLNGGGPARESVTIYGKVKNPERLLSSRRVFRLKKLRAVSIPRQSLQRYSSNLHTITIAKLDESGAISVDVDVEYRKWKKRYSDIVTINIYNGDTGDFRFDSGTVSFAAELDALEIACIASGIDSDDDGLGDDAETECYGTDPANWDSNNNGISDGNEALLVDLRVGSLATHTTFSDDNGQVLIEKIEMEPAGDFVPAGTIAEITVEETPDGNPRVAAVAHFVDDWQGEDAYLSATMLDGESGEVLVSQGAESIASESHFVLDDLTFDDAQAAPGSLYYVILEFRNSAGQIIGATETQIVVEGVQDPDVPAVPPPPGTQSVATIKAQTSGKFRLSVSTLFEYVSTVTLYFEDYSGTAPTASEVTAPLLEVWKKWELNGSSGLGSLNGGGNALLEVSLTDGYGKIRDLEGGTLPEVPVILYRFGKGTKESTSGASAKPELL